MSTAIFICKTYIYICSTSAFSFCMNIYTPFCARFSPCCFFNNQVHRSQNVKSLFILYLAWFICLLLCSISGLFVSKFHFVWQIICDTLKPRTHNEKFFLKYYLSCFISALFSTENYLQRIKYPIKWKTRVTGQIPGLLSGRDGSSNENKLTLK